MVQQIFTLVPRLNPSLGFVTAQEIQNATNNNNKKQKRNLDSGALRPRVITWGTTAVPELNEASSSPGSSFFKKMRPWLGLVT